MTGFARIDDMPVIFSATPVLPADPSSDYDIEKSTVLISVSYLNQPLLTQLRNQISLPDLSFIPARNGIRASGNQGIRPILSAKGNYLGNFTWTFHAPGQKIWSVIVPVILLLALLLAIASALVAWRIGSMSAALEESERKNRHNAHHDDLTGLGNRVSFRALAEHAESRVGVQPFALMMCDLDHFKTVNDTHGHQAGDMVIRTVAHRLSEVLTQTPESEGIASRVGGDEFALLFLGNPTVEALTIMARRIISTVTAPIEIAEGVVVRIGISIGIGLAPRDGRDLTTLQDAADKALYRAKASGRNSACFCHTLEETLSELADGAHIHLEMSAPVPNTPSSFGVHRALPARLPITADTAGSTSRFSSQTPFSTSGTSVSAFAKSHPDAHGQTEDPVAGRPTPALGTQDTEPRPQLQGANAG